MADGDGRGDAGNFINVGLFDAFEELAGVGRKGFDVTALAFGIKGVKGQAGFARARNAADHRDGVVRDHEIDVLEIVDPGAADADFLDVTRNDFGRAVGLSLVRDWLLCGFRRHVSKPKIIPPSVAASKLARTAGIFRLRYNRADCRLLTRGARERNGQVF